MTSKSTCKKIKPLASDKIFRGIDETSYLGKGGFSVVQRGCHLTHGLVAIKSAEIQEYDEDEIEELKKKTIKEVELQQQSSHDNVVRVHGWSQWFNVIAIVLEYLPTGNLKMMLDNPDVTINPLLRLRICYDVSNGLEYIHDQQIVHGDIKPENILLTKNLHAKIGDFGKAQKQNLNSQTQPSCDTYSFAVTMLKILGREIPIPFEQLLQGSRDSTNGQEANFCGINVLICNHIQKSSQFDIRVVDVMIDVMKKCWQENSFLRPLMKDVKRDLQELLNKQDPLMVKQQINETARELIIT